MCRPEGKKYRGEGWGWREGGGLGEEASVVGSAHAGAHPGGREGRLLRVWRGIPPAPPPAARAPGHAVAANRIMHLYTILCYSTATMLYTIILLEYYTTKLYVYRIMRYDTPILLYNYTTIHYSSAVLYACRATQSTRRRESARRRRGGGWPRGCAAPRGTSGVSLRSIESCSVVYNNIV